MHGYVCIMDTPRPVYLCLMFVPQAARDSFGSPRAIFTGERVTTGQGHRAAAG